MAKHRVVVEMAVTSLCHAMRVQMTPPITLLMSFLFYLYRVPNMAWEICSSLRLVVSRKLTTQLVRQANSEAVASCSTRQDDIVLAGVDNCEYYMQLMFQRQN